jgi:hypothetical protein
MEDLYQQWQESGLSRKAFCQLHDLSYATFNYWFKRLHDTGPSAPTGFTELNVPSTAAFSLEVVFPSGSRLVFQHEPSATWLRELLR